MVVHLFTSRESLKWINATYRSYNCIAAEVERSLDFLAASPTLLYTVFPLLREVLLANSPIITDNILPVPAWLKNSVKYRCKATKLKA